MKKTLAIIVSLACALICVISFVGCSKENSVEKVSHLKTYYLADTVVEQATSESPDDSEETQKAILKSSERIGDIIFMDFYIGQVINCFIQPVSDAMYNDSGLTSYKFTKKETTAETISQGISNSISTSNTVSMTASTENKLSWKFSTSVSATTSAEVGVNTSFVSAKAGVSETTAVAAELGGSTAFSTAESIAENVTRQSTDSKAVSKVLETTNESTFEYDMSKYEYGYYYVLALVADIEIHQVVAYNVKTKEFFTTYFVGNMENNFAGLRMLSSSSTSFNIDEEYRLCPVTEINIEEYIDENDISGGEEPPIGGEESSIDMENGNGSVEYPYIIRNEEDFKKLKENTSQNTYYKLVNSLELPAWNTPFEFTGHLDGNGKTVTYYQTISSAGNKGLFSRLVNAEVTNLYVDVHISDNNGDGTYAVGGLAGKTEGKVNISKVSVSGSIVLNDGVGVDYIGGIIGQFLGGTIEQCHNSALVETHAYTARSGGIVGYTCPTEMSIKISNCYNVGDVKACTAYIYGGRSAGGIVGQVKGHDTSTTIISNCYNDSVVRIVQDKNAAMGWWGCGGLYGDTASSVSTGIFVNKSYWNTSKCTRSGNNKEAHANSGNTDMTGTYSGWSADIWQFGANSAPKLIWMSAI